MGTRRDSGYFHTRVFGDIVIQFTKYATFSLQFHLMGFLRLRYQTGASRSRSSIEVNFLKDT